MGLTKSSDMIAITRLYRKVNKSGENNYMSRAYLR